MFPLNPVHRPYITASPLQLTSLLSDTFKMINQQPGPKSSIVYMISGSVCNPLRDPASETKAGSNNAPEIEENLSKLGNSGPPITSSCLSDLAFSSNLAVFLAPPKNLTMALIRRSFAMGNSFSAMAWRIARAHLATSIQLRFSTIRISDRAAAVLSG